MINSGDLLHVEPMLSREKSDDKITFDFWFCLLREMTWWVRGKYYLMTSKHVFNRQTNHFNGEKLPRIYKCNDSHPQTESSWDHEEIRNLFLVTLGHQYHHLFVSVFILKHMKILWWYRERSLCLFKIINQTHLYAICTFDKVTIYVIFLRVVSKNNFHLKNSLSIFLPKLLLHIVQICFFSTICVEEE